MLKKIFSKITKSHSVILSYLIIFIPVLAACFFIYTDYSYREAQEIRKNEQIAKVLAQNLDSYLKNVKTTLLSVSKLPAIQNGDRPEIEQIFKSLALSDSQVSLYWAIDTNGKILGKYPNTFPDKDEKKFVEKIINHEFFISEPKKGAITGYSIITLSTQIKDTNGKVIGVIGASLPLKNIQNKLSLRVGISGFPVLVTKSGKFLVHPQVKEINKTVNQEDPILKAIKSSGSGTLDIVSPLDGKRKFFSYEPLKEAGWIVVVVQPLSEFHQQIIKLITRNGIIILLVIFIALILTYFAVHKRKREEEARILQAEKLSIVGQLAAGMAHEIRNPLTIIRGFAQITSEQFAHQTKEYMDMIIKEVDRIEGIVKETLLLAKPTPVEFKLIDIKKTLKEVYALMEPQTNLKDIKLILSLSGEQLFCKAEVNQLKQVFINLIKNALEAITRSGGEIRISAKSFNNNIILTFKDNGCGIPEEILDKLGQPFISTKDNGTGLGLMVTYRIIQNHGGKINVESSPAGTVFTIELPMVKPV